MPFLAVTGQVFSGRMLLHNELIKRRHVGDMHVGPQTAPPEPITSALLHLERGRGP